MRIASLPWGVVGTECRERLGPLVEVVASVDGNLESELFASLTNRQRDQLRELVMTVRDHVNPVRTCSH
jgi:hypothetical protein